MRAIRTRTYVGVIVALAIVGGWLQPAHGATTKPSVKLIGTQKEITAKRFHKSEPAFVNLGAWLGSVGGAFVLHAKRSGYDQPIEVTQVDPNSPATVLRSLPDGSAAGWNGLADFFRIQVKRPNGKVTESFQSFCPAHFMRERWNDSGPTQQIYPVGCQGGSFTTGFVWGIEEGWAAPTSDFEGVVITGPDGDYRVTLSIPGTYRNLLGIPDASASVSVLVHLKTSDKPPPFPGPLDDRDGAAVQDTPPTNTMPPADTLPDLVAGPGFAFETQHRGGRNYLAFAAIEWNDGPAPLVVEGFRREGQKTMDAFQYFYRDGAPIARAPAGKLEYHAADHNHWHFRQFAQYDLVTLSGTVVSTSGKQAWCLAPTDPIDLTQPTSEYQPAGTDLHTACGEKESLWVREILDAGWGDTYYQYFGGQAMDVTGVPDGRYKLKVQVNPSGLLHEADPTNNISYREIKLGTTAGGRRTVVAKPWNGITQ